MFASSFVKSKEGFQVALERHTFWICFLWFKQSCGCYYWLTEVAFQSKNNPKNLLLLNINPFLKFIFTNYRTLDF